jgi:1,2-dihydroxy-3-keto-5-methylthiopentene dioxygenase
MIGFASSPEESNVRVYKEVGRDFPRELLSVMTGLPIDDPAKLELEIEAFKKRHGYVTHDIVTVTPETPNEALMKFDKPHRHSEDEIRLFLEGSGIFDLRAQDGTWYRFVLGRGDMIVVPAGTVHRFEPTFQKALRCVRIFRDTAGWVANYVD